MRITKRQLRRIIKEEKAKIMREEEGAVNPNQHHYPSADKSVGQVVEELTAGWHDMELAAWSAGDPSMNNHGELSDAESKEYWNEQVETATGELKDALEDRLRGFAISVMEEYTEKLINGDYS